MLYICLVPLLFAQHVFSLALEKIHDVRDTYDYVVVGGGVSGLVVASRLSEDLSKTVLVIEHGRIDDGLKTMIPRAAGEGPIAEVWNVTSAPVERLDNSTFPVTMASVVGGGSVINGMLADRGSKADYDAWEALGNEGWGWERLLPYFQKSTNFTLPLPELVKDYGYKFDVSAYGNGPLQVSYPSVQFPDIKNITAALSAHGVRTPNSPDGGDALGAVWAPSTLDFYTGRRCHARVAYYDPISDRPNLHLITEQLVDEILFENLTTIGIHFVSRRDNNNARSVAATREVILAAGAINTPKLLQLSGIGPKETLSSAGIEVKLDMPSVGANFQDHPTAYVSWNLSSFAFPSLEALYTNTTYNASAWEEYITNHTGPYTVARGNAAVFLPLSQVTPDKDVIIREILAQDPADYLPSVYKDQSLLAGYQAQRDILVDHFGRDDAAVSEFPFKASGVGVAALQKPLSRGTVTVDPNNPQGQPLVQYNTFMNPVDRRLVVEQIRYVRELYKEPLLLGYQPVEVTPGLQYQTDEEIIKDAIAAGIVNPSFAHPSGTCGMLPAELGGCVDSELRVYGTQRLSVVDASIMPLIPATHLQTTVYAVAEKAADIIKARSG